jgi:hypothetical protein
MTKAPYRPTAAGRIAFFFGPVAGALVTVTNLRRYGYPLKANKVLLWTLLAAAVLSVVLIVTPDLLGRVIGLAAEFAAYKVYSGLQEKEFNEWQTAHPDIAPLNGWGALGWGFAGLVVLFMMIVGIGFILALLLPSLMPQ